MVDIIGYDIALELIIGECHTIRIQYRLHKYKAITTIGVVTSYMHRIEKGISGLLAARHGKSYMKQTENLLICICLQLSISIWSPVSYTT